MARLPTNPSRILFRFLQAIQYLQKYVVPLKSPLVICLGIGTSLGDHTGGGMLGNYIDYISRQKSHVFVTDCGNEGNSAHLLWWYEDPTAKSAYQTSIAPTSGRGFARDNYIVPEIAAPGVDATESARRQWLASAPAVGDYAGFWHRTTTMQPLSTGI
mgnify:CR=1 FL=1